LNFHHGPRSPDRTHKSQLNLVIRLIYTILILVMINPLGSGYAAPVNQISSSRERAQALLESMKPEERVGQLFLVTFTGSDAGQDSQIYDLITNHHIGGVILQVENDNFQPSPNTLAETLQLTRQLQAAEQAASRTTQIDPISNEEFTPAFIPLFIGIAQEGDSYPYDHILEGLTPLPSQMAIGATWKPELARQVGTVLGEELSALGINLVLSPSLDVLDNPHTRGAGDLGVRTFGGEPYWVGLMGREYITGLHEGSLGRLAVVAKHFPGHGSADRLPEEDIATVRKSLESLRQIELPPFFAVTQNLNNPAGTVDGLLASHIRYQGFQGNIRETTPPVSLSPTAFEALMELPTLATWREAGGLMVSDNLGSRALRRYGIEPNRFIARDAFQAGNDLLFLGKDFIAEGDEGSYPTTIRTISFFNTKYRDDAIFKQRVDESVLRILTLKFRIYEDIFTLSNVQSTTNRLAEIGDSDDVTFEITQSAATLIHPSLPELAETLPEGPNLNDRIIFISDTRTARQCSQCPDSPVFPVNALEQAVIRLYGPFAGGQVLQRNLRSYSNQDLITLLDADQEEEPLEIETNLQQAQWIVFSMLNMSINDPSTQALPRFLAEKPELFRGKRLIVFAFNAPYYLDATEVSKLTAYYGLYTKVSQAIEVAARLLFREIPSPPGSLPVSVPGIGYDVISATAPDPNRIIGLELELPETSTGEGTLAPEIPVSFNIRDLIWIRTDIIRDINNHQVPDGTQVEFIFRIGSEEFRQKETTRRGVARSSFLIDRSGPLEIRAESEPARQSHVLRFDIPPEMNGGTPLAPTPAPTETPTQEPTVTLAPIVDDQSLSNSPKRPGMGDWFLAVLVTAVFGGAIYLLISQNGMLRWGVRSAFLALIGGLVAYTYLALALPGSSQLLQTSGTWGILSVTVFGASLGWLIAWGWQKVDDRLGN
jgi:beta-N-acetylhexosaminidase